MKKEPVNIEHLVQYVKDNPNDTKVKNALNKIALKDPVKVIASIVRMSANLYDKEIANFKIARQIAKDIHNPNRALLTELYNDIHIDGFIYGMFNKRVLKISNKKVKVVNAAGEKDIEKTKLLQKKWFNDFTKYAMESKFFGYSLVYFSELEASRIKKTKLVYREHVIPDRNIFVQNPYDIQGFDFTKPPYSNYCIGIGEPEDLGLYEKAAIYYILKKHSWQNWDQFEEIFGIPIRIAKTASQDNKVKASIESWLASMGSAAYGIFPSDAELDIKENKATDAFQVFYEKIKACNAELEILITGQNRVTQNGGSYAKEKAMETETDELTEDDKEFQFYIFNDHLLPLLINLGYPYQEGDVIQWDDDKQLTQKERMELFKGVDELGYETDPVQIEKEFGITIKGKKEIKLPPSGNEKLKQKPSNAFVKMHHDINKLYNHV